MQLKMKTIIFTFLIFSFFLFPFSFLFAQVDFGVGIDFTPKTSEKASKQEKEQKNYFIERIALKFNQNYEKLHRLYQRGYGYIELLKLILISEKSKKELDEIIKYRDKKDKISKIASMYGLNYKEIYLEAYRIRSELESDTTEQFLQ